MEAGDIDTKYGYMPEAFKHYSKYPQNLEKG